MGTLATELAWVESGLEEYDADNNLRGRRECEVIGRHPWLLYLCATLPGACRT